MKITSEHHIDLTHREAVTMLTEHPTIVQVIKGMFPDDPVTANLGFHLDAMCPPPESTTPENSNPDPLRYRLMIKQSHKSGPKSPAPNP